MRTRIRGLGLMVLCALLIVAATAGSAAALEPPIPTPVPTPDITPLPTPDGVPPVLAAFSFAPTAVDVTLGEARVDIEAHVTATGSGCAAVRVDFVAPGSAPGPLPMPVDIAPGVPTMPPPEPVPGGSTMLSLSVGTNTDGIWKGAIAIPPFAPAGAWKAQVTVYDFVRITRTLSDLDLAAAGFPSTLKVTSAADVTPPALATFSLTPDSIDVSTGIATIDIEAHATDTLAGVGTIVVSLAPPGSSPEPSTVPSPVPGVMMPVPAPSIFPWPVPGATSYLSLHSGTQRDGVWRGTITIPRYAADGAWNVSVLLYDTLGNTRSLGQADLASAGFPSKVDVASNPDTKAPVLTDFSFLPTAADVSSQSVTVDIVARATDDLSGAESIFVSFVPPDSSPEPWPIPGPMPLPPVSVPGPDGSVGTSPGGSMGGGTAVTGPAGTPAMPGVMPPGRYFGGSTMLWLSDGTKNSGKWRGSITIPQFAQMGSWSAQVSLYDGLGNSKTVTSADLAAAGFPATLTVVSVPDLTPPDTTTNAKPDYIDTGLILLNPVDAGGSGVGNTFYRVDGGAATTGTAVPIMTPGTHTVEYWSVDQAGNAEPPKTVTVVIAAGKASTSITIGPSKTRLTRGTSLLLSGVLRPGKLGDRVVVEIRKPGSTTWTKVARYAYAITSSNGAKWSYRLNPRTRGTNRFRVRFYGDTTRKSCVSRTISVSVR